MVRVDVHLLHDDYVRTLDPSQASLFYVPTFLMQRHTWGSQEVAASIRAVASPPVAAPTEDTADAEAASSEYNALEVMTIGELSRQKKALKKVLKKVLRKVKSKALKIHHNPMNLEIQITKI